MSTRIIFNGQEYAGVEAMPQEVRNAYLAALAMLRDANADGIPDVVENGPAGTIIGVQQSSVTLNGQQLGGAGGLPVWARRLVASAIEQGLADRKQRPEPPGSDPPGEPMDAAQGTMGALLAFGAGFVVIFAVGLMLALGGGRDRLAGRLVIAVAALLMLGWLDTHATRLARRRQPLLAPDTAGYRRFVVWSASGLLLVTILLLGLAWYLP